MYIQEAPTFEIPARYLEDSGLFCKRESRDSIVLFCRSEFARQFRFLKETVMVQGCLGWILGAPGCGKSSAAFAFLTSELDNPDWRFTWIHMESSIIFCVSFDRNRSTAFKKDYDEVDSIKTYLRQSTGGKRHFVFLDGYYSVGSAAAKQQRVSDACENWLDQDRDNHRLCKLCSMTTRGKTNMDEDWRKRVAVCRISSWTLNEYQKAFLQPEVEECYGDNLDSSMLKNSDQQELADKVESKHYFAGGCARYMFSYPTVDVLENVREAISSFADIYPYLSGEIGEQSVPAINCLLCTFVSQEGEEPEMTTLIVSSYAASEFAFKQGPELIQRLAKNLYSAFNPVVQGILFEMWFFALIRVGDVVLNRLGHNVKFEKAKIRNVDPVSPIPLPSCSKIWFKPVKWNQGGYNAVHVDYDECLVSFIQVTKSPQHSLKLEYFSELLSNLTLKRPKTSKVRVEIIVLIPKEQVSKFKISPVTGRGLLGSYKTKNSKQWVKGKEEGLVDVLTFAQDWD